MQFRKIRKAGLAACLFLFPGFITAAQDLVFDEGSARAFQLALDFRTDQATELVSAPTTLAGHYVASLSSTIALLLSEDASKLAAYEEESEKRLEVKFPAPDQQYFLESEVNLHMAFVYLKFGQEFDAALHFRQAYVNSHQLTKRYPRFRAALKTAGLLNVIIGSVPEKYNWILGLMNMDGSVEKGIVQLKELGGSAHVLATETTLWHCFIRGFILQGPGEALSILNSLKADERETAMAAFLTANLYIKNAQSEPALKILNKLSREENRSIPYVHYLRGEVLLHKGDYIEAISAYQAFARDFKGQNYIKDAFYKTGLCYWLSGDEGMARELFARAKVSGKESAEADRHAAKSLAEPQLPHVMLSRVRYYTDGGYYQDAKKILAEIDPAKIPVAHHRVEYFYRKARLHHRLDEREEARKEYIRTIRETGEEEWYFAPNACLMLGYLSKDAGQTAEARSWFEKALRYKRHEYKNSIDSKARSALAQLPDEK